MTDNPFVRPTTPPPFQFIDPKPQAGGWRILVLERIVEGVTPEYCIHGKVTCHRCEAWCWLGERTYADVIKGDTAPMCMECATEIGVGVHGVPIGNLRDGDAHQ